MHEHEDPTSGGQPADDNPTPVVGTPATGWVPVPAAVPPSPPAASNVAPAPAQSKGIRQLLADRMSGWVAAVLALGAVLGLSIALATTSTAPRALPLRNGPNGALSPEGTTPGGSRPADGGFPGGSAFGSGGTLGTVDAVSAKSFTMTTSTGAKVTVDEESSTTYRTFAGTASKSSLALGDRALVTGSKSGSTIKATEIIVLPSRSGRGGFGGFGGNGSNGGSPTVQSAS